MLEYSLQLIGGISSVFSRRIDASEGLAEAVWPAPGVEFVDILRKEGRHTA